MNCKTEEYLTARINLAEQYVDAIVDLIGNYLPSLQEPVIYDKEYI